MIEREIAINILEDIQESLNNTKDWKDKSLKTTELYRKGIELSIDENIKQLIEKHKQYVKKYGESDKRTINIDKKIDEEIQKIYNS